MRKEGESRNKRRVTRRCSKDKWKKKRKEEIIESMENDDKSNDKEKW